MNEKKQLSSINNENGSGAGAGVGNGVDDSYNSYSSENGGDTSSTDSENPMKRMNGNGLLLGKHSLSLSETNEKRKSVGNLEFKITSLDLSQYQVINLDTENGDDDDKKSSGFDPNANYDEYTQIGGFTEEELPRADSLERIDSSKRSKTSSSSPLLQSSLGTEFGTEVDEDQDDDVRGKSVEEEEEEDTGVYFHDLYNKIRDHKVNKDGDPIMGYSSECKIKFKGKKDISKIIQAALSISEKEFIERSSGVRDKKRKFRLTFIEYDPEKVKFPAKQKGEMAIVKKEKRNGSTVNIIYVSDVNYEFGDGLRVLGQHIYNVKDEGSKNIRQASIHLQYQKWGDLGVWELVERISILISQYDSIQRFIDSCNTHRERWDYIYNYLMFLYIEENYSRLMARVRGTSYRLGKNDLTEKPNVKPSDEYPNVTTIYYRITEDERKQMTLNHSTSTSKKMYIMSPQGHKYPFPDNRKNDGKEWKFTPDKLYYNIFYAKKLSKIKN
jgi:hypothetical protein